MAALEPPFKREPERGVAGGEMSEGHVCKKLDYCMCYALADEPDEDCPVHGSPWPLRCGKCGRFVSHESLGELPEAADA